MKNLDLFLKEASVEDSKYLFDLRNDIGVRESAKNSEVISFETHEKWFAKKLSDSMSKIYIVWWQDVKAGQVRIDADQTLTIAVDVNMRGKGLGALMLKAAVEKYQKEVANKPIFADIKDHNKNSISIFEKAGFKFLKRKEENNISYSQYVYEMTRLA
jgi:ribosomal protein S18 acetylase RimI-like enzyme